MKFGNIEESVRDVVRGIPPGTCTHAIETKTGIKIVYVADRAEPGKAGSQQTRYSITYADIKYRGEVMLQKDIDKLNSAVKKLVEAKSPDAFANICKKSGIKTVSEDVTNPNPYCRELIMKAKETRKPVVAESIDDENSVRILVLAKEATPNAHVPTLPELAQKVNARRVMVVAESVLMMIKEATPNAPVPTLPELAQKVHARRVMNEFERNIRRVRAMVHSKLFENNLTKVIQ
jgi:hypothetical protein